MDLDQEAPDGELGSESAPQSDSDDRSFEVDEQESGSDSELEDDSTDDSDELVAIDEMYGSD
jgi:hypothetical protein